MDTVMFERSQWALTIIRILLGFIFIMHGSNKTIGWFGGSGLQGFAQWLHTSFSIPFFIGYMAALFEFIAGWLLVLGIAAEVGAALTIPVMIAAIYLVHTGKGFFVESGGFEYAFVLIILAIAVIIGGPCKLALWNPFSYLSERKLW